MHISSFFFFVKTAEVAHAHGSLVSFAGLLSASRYTAVQIHAKLIIELKKSMGNLPFLCRLGEVAMLSTCAVLHLSRPVRGPGNCSAPRFPVKQSPICILTVE